MLNTPKVHINSVLSFLPTTFCEAELSERFALQEKLHRRHERRCERDSANDEDAEPDLVHSK